VYVWAGFLIEAEYMGSGWRVRCTAHVGIQSRLRSMHTNPLLSYVLKRGRQVQWYHYGTDVDMQSYVGIMLSQLAKLQREFKRSPRL